MRKMLVAVGLVVVGFGVGVAGRGEPVWQHWIVGDALAPDGRSALANALDAVEAGGYEVRFVFSHPRNGVVLFDVVGRKKGEGEVVVVAPAAPASSCVGLPPFPGAKCYPDGGWRP